MLAHVHPPPSPREAAAAAAEEAEKQEVACLFFRFFNILGLFKPP
jgi:hypothetical protein